MTLSERQRRILEFIEDYIDKHEFPPSIREIGNAVNISSTSVVNYNLKKLEAAQYIKRDPSVSRGIRLLKRLNPPASKPEASLKVPLLGRISAGQPIPVPDVSSQDPYSGETIELTEILAPDPENLYALEVRGDSMIDALVGDGDLVILRHQRTAENGEMVVAWLKDQEETTLKYFYHKGDHVELRPANPRYDPIIVPADQVEIHGKVVAVIRRLG